MSEKVRGSKRKREGGEREVCESERERQKQRRMNETERESERECEQERGRWERCVRE